jgi:hypothetical protein
MMAQPGLQDHKDHKGLRVLLLLLGAQDQTEQQAQLARKVLLG